MIQREWQSVTVNTYSDTLDTYGQKRQSTPTTRTVEMVVKQYSATNTSDIRYSEIDVIGITKDTQITDKNTITIGSITYDIKYIIPSGKYTQVLMRKKQ